MPQKIPEIPKVDKKTSYQGVKAILEKLRAEFVRSYLLDSTSISVVDNPGQGRSPEVNFPTQGPAGTTLPLQPYVSSESGTPKISVYPGTFGLNAEASSGTSVPLIGATRIDAATPPRLTVAVGDILLYLKVTVDADGLITEVKVQSTSSASPPSPTLYTIYYVRLCTMVVTSPDIVALGVFELAGSQSWELCGGSTPLWRLT